MKIGILTYHNAHNYGAMLQAYGLQKTIKQMGHDVQFVHYYPESIENKNKRSQKLSSLKQLFLRIAVLVLSYKFKKRFESFEKFKKSYFILTKRYYTRDSLIQDPPSCDAFICGSDQIWNMEAGCNLVYFLKFPCRQAIKIAYAPSFGRDTIPEDVKRKLPDLLKSFDFISVRESSGVSIVQEATDKKITQAIDPVFLIGSKQWDEIIVNPQFKGRYICFYSLEMSVKMRQLLKIISRRLNLPVVILGKGGEISFFCKTIWAIESGPAEFLGWLKNAVFVCTNSFHSLAFSIIFQKPFLVVPHLTRNTRLSNLLKLTNLEDRQISDIQTLKNMSTEQLLHVDFREAQDNLKKEMQNSLSFLKNSLKNS